MCYDVIQAYTMHQSLAESDSEHGSGWVYEACRVGSDCIAQINDQFTPTLPTLLNSPVEQSRVVGVNWPQPIAAACYTYKISLLHFTPVETGFLLLFDICPAFCYVTALYHSFRSWTVP